MNVIALLKEMHRAGELNSGQLDVLSEIHLKKRYSVHRELRVAIYVGVLLISAGVGLTIRQYFAQLGDIAIVGSLSSGALASFGYCFMKGRPWSSGEVESPSILFDYVLLFGCTLYAADVGYIETQFHVLGDSWHNYLLVSAALFFFLAYRFDNRLVLSMALSTLAAWFGFQLSVRFLSFHKYYRESAIAYGLITFAAGSLSHRLAVKKHFFDIYLNFTVHFLLAALLSGVAEYRFSSWHLPAMAAAIAAVAVYAMRNRRFLYMLYAVLYGYACLSAVAVAFIDGAAAMYLYGIVSSLAVIGLIFILSRRFKEGT
ncbi:MAG TPA: DUF2157 domain-containing protein [Syntrophales bacterium]|nr:DUF2157 domain-containing protein [Syntrophales bacterium]